MFEGSSACGLFNFASFPRGDGIRCRRYAPQLLMLLLLVFTPFGAHAGEDSSSLIDKVVSVYGGRERLLRLTGVRETGRVQAAAGMGASGPLLRVFEAPSTLRIELGSPPDVEVRVLVAKKAWRNGQPASNNAALDAMVLQALRLDLPRQLLLHKTEIAKGRPVTYEGKRVRTLELHLEHGLSMTAGVDPESGKILFWSGWSANLPSGPMGFETRYDDFRVVKGFLFAFKEVNLAGGFKTGDTLLSNIEVSEQEKTGR